MIRPTASFHSELPAGFYFDAVNRSEQNEMADIIFQAHQNGYTASVEGQLDHERVEGTLRERLQIFSANHTLDMGVVVKEARTSRIVGVCIAGIYPDVPNCFSTIHQVAVHPLFQHQGIASAMISHVVDAARRRSPVILLGVTIGNPAQRLYRRLGFRQGPVYSDYLFERKRRKQI